MPSASLSATLALNPTSSVRATSTLLAVKARSTAFGVSRLVLCAIFALSVLSNEVTIGWGILVAMVAAAVGAVASIAWLIQTYRGDQTARADYLPAWALIAIDAVLALAIILTSQSSSAPLAWVALVIPVTETALAYGLMPAAAVWLALSLSHMSFVVSKTTSGATSPVLALQQLLAVLLVAVPAGILTATVRTQIEDLTREREKADGMARQLQAVAEAAERMTGEMTSAEVLSEATRSLFDLGFDQVDIVIPNRDQKWRTLVSHHRMNKPGANASMLAEQAAKGREIAVLRPDTDISRQELHLAGMEWGCAVALDTVGFYSKPVIRAWSSRPMVDESDTLRSFRLLTNQIDNIHRNAVAAEWASQETERLAFAAAHDPLTGLANHGTVMSTLQALCDAGRSATVFFIDLDRFKPINDTLGHEAGDRVLVAIGRRLEKLIGEAGTPGRMGGDEFIVVGDTELLTVEDDPYRVADYLHQVIGETISLGAADVAVGSSIGAAIGAADVGADELTRRADVAMYSAKRGGGGSQVWSAALDEANREAAANASIELANR